MKSLDGGAGRGPGERATWRAAVVGAPLWFGVAIAGGPGVAMVPRDVLAGVRLACAATAILSLTATTAAATATTARATTTRTTAPSPRGDLAATMALMPRPRAMPTATATATATATDAATETATAGIESVAGAPAPPAGHIVDSREVIVPVPGAERMRIDNPLGNVTVRAWDRTDAIHIVAEKQSASPEALARLRVHFTAWAGGEVSVETRVEMAGRERALPLIASRVDLLIEVPPELEIEAKTFAGDLSAAGLRSGARLETTAGRIGVSNVRGRVVTHQLRGGQTVAEVDGDVDLDGVEGSMRLDHLLGARVVARVVDGDIHAHDIQSDEVRLSTTTGAVVLLGVLRPRAHYDLRSYSGEVRLEVVTAPPGSAARTVGFELHTRSAAPTTSAFPVHVLWRQGNRLRAVVVTASAHGDAVAVAGTREDRPVVELHSVLGRVVLTSAQPIDRLPLVGPSP